MQLHDGGEPDDRLYRGRHLAAAIGIGGDIRGEQRPQPLHVAAAGGREERRGDLQAALLGQRKAGARRAHVAARAAGELTAGRRRTTDRRGDLVEADAEHVVEEKGGAFQRRQALERQHQRQGDVVDLVLRRLDHRLRQPGPR